MPKQWHVSQLRLTAFKSFAESTTLDVPSHQLVGLTGPNGCGKSNLLEAICFSSGCPVSELRSKQLKDVQSTDQCRQLCQVQLVVSNGVHQHTILATLTPEGGRCYKLDGKLKTGAQIKQFLRSKGLTVDGSTVIKQATVTQLADCNDSVKLSEEVAKASGLARWQEQASAAAAELQRTEQSVQRIHANLQQLKAAIGGDEARLQAAMEAQAAQREMQRVAQELAGALQAQEHQQQAAAGAHAQSKQTSQAQFEQLQLQVQAYQEQGAGAAAQSAAASEGLHDTLQTLEQLQQQVLLAEHSCKLLQEEATAEAQQLAQLGQQRQLLLAKQQEQQAVQQQLQAAQSNVDRLQALLHAAEQDSASATRSAHQLQLLQLQASEAASPVQGQEQQVQQDHLKLQRAEQQAATLQGRLQQLMDAAGRVKEDTGFLADASHSSSSSSSRLEREVRDLETAIAQTEQRLLHADVQSSQLAAMMNSRAMQALQQLLPGLQTPAGPAAHSMTSQVPNSHGSNRHHRSNSSSSNSHSRSSSARLAPGAAPGPSSSSCTLAPLLDAFTVRNAGEDGVQRVAPALAAICSSSTLGTLLADTSSKIQEVLGALAAAGPNWRQGKVRLWPLDQLQARDFSSQQQAAQASLGKDRVVLPLDLLQYPPQYHAAMQRAFGSYVIVSDDAVAAEVVNRFGLSCVTMQGCVSHKGCMSGGWSAPQQNPNLQRWQQKLQLDALHQQKQHLLGELQGAQQQHTQLQEQLVYQQQVLDLQQQLEAADSSRAAAAQQHQAAVQLLAQLQQQAQQCHARLQQQQQHQPQNVKDPSNSSATPETLQGLAAQLSAAEEQVAALQLQMDQLGDQVEDLNAALEAAACQSTDTSHLALDQQQQQLADLRQELEQCNQHHLQQVATVKQAQQHLQEQQQLLATAQAQAQSLGQQLQQLDADVAAAQGAAAAASKRLGELLSQFSRLALLQQQLPPAAGPQGSGLTNGQREKQQHQIDRKVSQLERKLEKLLKECAGESLAGVSTADQVLAQKRLQQVAEFEEQAATLAAAAAALQQQMAVAGSQVQAAHQAVVQEVADAFQLLCASLLPALEVELVTGQGSAAAGLQLRFRLQTAADGPAAEQEAPRWQTSLQQLSGGQRTLVSLAFLLATARAGSSSRLLLLDEVDAALDEHNQRRVAELLRQLAAGSSDPADQGAGAHKRVPAAAGGATCQIVCISHNAAFQAACHATMSVGGAASRAKPDAAGGSRAQAAAGSSKRSRNQATSTAAAGRAGVTA